MVKSLGRALVQGLPLLVELAALPLGQNYGALENLEGAKGK